MTVQALSDFQYLIKEYVDARLAILKDNVAARGPNTLLAKIPMIDGAADSIRWHVNHTGITGASFSPGADSYPTAGAQSLVEAKLGYKYLVTTIDVDGRLRDADHAGGGLKTTAEAQSAIALLLDQAFRDLLLTLENQLMGDGTGNSGKDLDGLGAGIGAANTYAGIDRSSYAWWASAVAAATGNAWTEAQHQAKLEALLETPRNGAVDECWTTFAVQHKIANVLKSSNPVQFVNTSDLRAGMTALIYEGIPIARINGYTAGRLDFVDTRQLELHVIRNAEVRQLGVTNDRDQYAVTFGANLKCTNPRGLGALTGITA